MSRGRLKGQKRKPNIVSSYIGVFCGFIVAFYYLRYAVTSSEQIWILPIESNVGNIKIYVFSVVLFALSSIVTAYISGLLGAEKLNDISFRKCKYGLVTVVALCIAILSRPLAHFNEIPLLGNLAAYLLVTSILFFFVRISNDEKHTTLGTIIVYGVLIVCAFIWLLTYARINTFYVNSSGSMASNITNTSAYIDSIYNVYLDKPYQGDVTEQYGHYGLFYKLPLLIMGANTKTIAILVGIVAAITYLALMYAFCSVVESNIFRVLTGFAVAYVPIELMPSTYWQFSPHRLFFPALTVAWIAFLGKKGITTRRIIISEIFCALAMLWNWESGAVSVLTIALYFCMQIFFEEKRTIKKTIKNILLAISVIPTGILGCWLIVALFNLINGGGGALC